MQKWNSLYLPRLRQAARGLAPAPELEAVARNLVYVPLAVALPGTNLTIDLPVGADSHAAAPEPYGLEDSYQVEKGLSAGGLSAFRLLSQRSPHEVHLFRGTNMPGTAAEEGKIASGIGSDFDLGGVGKGAYDEAWTNALSGWSADARDRGNTITVVGTSLGGTLAYRHTSELCEDGHSDVRCYAFAPFGVKKPDAERLDAYIDSGSAAVHAYRTVGDYVEKVDHQPAKARWTHLKHPDGLNDEALASLEKNPLFHLKSGMTAHLNAALHHTALNGGRPEVHVTQAAAPQEQKMLMAVLWLSGVGRGIGQLVRRTVATIVGLWSAAARFPW